MFSEDAVKIKSSEAVRCGAVCKAKRSGSRLNIGIVNIRRAEVKVWAM